MKKTKSWNELAQKWMMAGKNNIFIISAPSGSGKSTLIQLLVAQDHNLFFSISHTTRPPREGEKDGSEYYFLTEKVFQEMIRNQEFLEWAQVHGFYYGTSKSMVQEAESSGRDLILDIDVQGAEKVKSLLPDATSIFIVPPSFEVLRERLQRRQKDTEEQIEKRLENARQEIRYSDRYDYIIINRDLHAAFEDLNSIIRSQKCRRINRLEEVQTIIDSFNR